MLQSFWIKTSYLDKKKWKKFFVFIWFFSMPLHALLEGICDYSNSLIYPKNYYSLAFLLLHALETREAFFWALHPCFLDATALEIFIVLFSPLYFGLFVFFFKSCWIFGFFFVWFFFFSYVFSQFYFLLSLLSLLL